MTKTDKTVVNNMEIVSYYLFPADSQAFTLRDCSQYLVAIAGRAEQKNVKALLQNVLAVINAQATSITNQHRLCWSRMDNDYSKRLYHEDEHGIEWSIPLKPGPSETKEQ